MLVWQLLAVQCALPAPAPSLAPGTQAAVLTDSQQAARQTLPAPSPQSDPGAQPAPPRAEYPVGVLFTCPQRTDYQTGDMLLSVPVLGLEAVPVQNGTTDQMLAQGPGLYELSQPPAKGNANVCIAGHRGVHGAEFYRIDQLGEGDTAQLCYGGFLWDYVFLDSKVVEPDDWSVVACTEQSTLTLTSCHPMSTSAYRMVVRFVLQSTRPAEN